MKRFKQFVLQEKISQKEINSVYSDSNITFGMEFEYIDDNLVNYEGGGQDLEELQNMYDQLVRDVDDLKTEAENDKEEWETEIRDEINSEIKDKEDSIDDLEKAIEQLEDEIKVLEDRLDDPDLDPEDDENLITELEYEKDEKDEKKDEYLEQISELRDEIDDIEDNVYDYADEHRMEYDFFERNPYSGITIPSELLDWWDEVGYPDDGKITNEIYMYALYDEGDWDNDLPYPANDYYGSDGVDEESIESSLNFDDLPFDNYEVSDYHGGSATSSNWRIEPDSSLSAGGVEIISPSLPITQAKEIIKDMFDYIKANGDTDNSTGLHVHLGYKGANLSKDLDLLKLMMFVEEDWIFKNFPEREGSSYALSMLDKLDKSFKNHPDYPSQTFKAGKDDIQWIFKTFKDDVLPGSTKYNSVNWQPIDEGHIEIRWLGGTNYHRKYKEVITALGKFATYLKLALDPEYKKIEYLKKLYRFAEKTDTLRSEKEINETKKMIKVIEREGTLLGIESSDFGSGKYYYDYKDDVYSVYTPGHDKNIIELNKVGKTKKFYNTRKKIKNFKIETENWLKIFKRI